MIGQKFVLGLARRIRSQVGVDGQGYPPIKKSTAIARGPRRLKKGTAKINGVPTTFGGMATSLKRLFVTGDLAASGFNYAVRPEGVTVFAPDSLHRSGGATYADIIKYNSRNWEPNKNITGPPLVFPKTSAEVAMMRDEMNFARMEIKKAITAHLKAQIPPKTEIPIG